MPWPTTDDVLNSLSSVLKQPLAQMPALWGEVAARALEEAKSDVYDSMCSAGFDTATVNAWDDLATYATRMSLYWCLIHGTGLVAFDFQFINAFDVRKAMSEKAVIRVGGKPTAPATGESDVGGITSGRTVGGAALDAAFRCRPDIPW